MLRHISSLLRILVAAATPETYVNQTSVSFDKHLPWLMDSVEALNDEQRRWEGLFPYSPASLLEQALNMARSIREGDSILTHKLYAAMALIAADVAEQIEESEDQVENLKSANKTLALALVHLAFASLKKRSTGRLAASQLLTNLDWLLSDSSIQADEDLKVRSTQATR